MDTKIEFLVKITADLTSHPDFSSDELIYDYEITTGQELTPEGVSVAFVNLLNDVFSGAYGGSSALSAELVKVL